MLVFGLVKAIQNFSYYVIIIHKTAFVLAEWKHVFPQHYKLDNFSIQSFIKTQLTELSPIIKQRFINFESIRIVLWKMYCNTIKSYESSYINGKSDKKIVFLPHNLH